MSGPTPKKKRTKKSKPHKWLELKPLEAPAFPWEALPPELREALKREGGPEQFKDSEQFIAWMEKKVAEKLGVESFSTAANADGSVSVSIQSK